MAPATQRDGINGGNVNAKTYVTDMLGQAEARLTTTRREFETTAELTTPEGVRAHAEAAACYASDRKQVAYWRAQLADVGRTDGWWGRAA